MTSDALVEAFKALGDVTRLSIVQRLGTRGPSRCGPVGVGERGLCACDVESAVALSQAAVSHHMAILRRAGLVRAEKRGRWMFYRRDEEALEAVAQALEERLQRVRPPARARRARASAG
jgi:ArsR family transcriptional regulator, arsenate/arsenite/antimonite-responsive transcriptional repressor